MFTKKSKVSNYLPIVISNSPLVVFAKVCRLSSLSQLCAYVVGPRCESNPSEIISIYAGLSYINITFLPLTVLFATLVKTSNKILAISGPSVTFFSNLILFKLHMLIHLIAGLNIHVL